MNFTLAGAHVNAIRRKDFSGMFSGFVGFLPDAFPHPHAVRGCHSGRQPIFHELFIFSPENKGAAGAANLRGAGLGRGVLSLESHEQETEIFKLSVSCNESDKSCYMIPPRMTSTVNLMFC
jgi:hypothetical protein